MKDQPWLTTALQELPNEALARLLEDIADDAEEAPDRTISAVGLADILLVVSDRLTPKRYCKKPAKSFGNDLDLLSTRAQKACIEVGVSNIDQLSKKTAVEFLLLPKCGKKTLHEIRTFLNVKGQKLKEDIVGAE